MNRGQYNGFGNVVQVTDPIGRTQTNTYASNMIDLLAVQQQVGGNLQTLASFTYGANHLPLTITDAAGNTSYLGYNNHGQLIAVTNALNQTNTMSYDTNGYLTNVLGSLPGSAMSFTYDSYGRVRTVTDSQGYTITISYDAADRPTNISYPDGTYSQTVYNYLDPVLQEDRDGHWVAKEYDPLRHLTDLYDNLGRHTQFGYCSCGALESITDPLGRVTTFVLDLEKRLTSKIFPDSTALNYAYQTNSGRLQSVTDARGQTTQYQYFIDNNPSQVSYSNAVVATSNVSFTYDTNYNRLLTMTDGTGTTTNSYYAVTNGQLGAGMLQSVTGPWANSTITYGYDPLGRVLSRAINGVAQQVTYDALGRVTVLTNALGGFTNTYVGATMEISTNFYPNGQEAVFSYLSTTNDERLAEIWNQNNGGATLSKFDYTYDPLGQITTWTQQTDTNSPDVYALNYDAGNQLLSAVLSGTGVGAAVLQQYAYIYDLAGNRVSGQIGTGMNQSSYNVANQLTNRSAGTGGSMMFAGALDKQGTVTVAGNPATVNHLTTNFVGYASVTNGTNVVPIIATDYNGNSRTNKYQVVVTNNGVSETISYDLNGNETSVITATSTNVYQWDAANRLVSITGPTNKSVFAYDGLGRRTQITEYQNNVAISTNMFLWCGMELCEERDYTGGTVIKRFFGGGEQISGTNYFFTRDHLGSIREMVDSSGTTQVRYGYDPYGGRTKLSGSLDADFAFTGFYYHAPSGLYLAPFRTYDSSLGRWLNRDPIGEGGGINLYGFVGNNPINEIDLLGLCGWNPFSGYSWIGQFNTAAPGFLLSGPYSYYSGSGLASDLAAGPANVGSFVANAITGAGNAALIAANAANQFVNYVGEQSGQAGIDSTSVAMIFGLGFLGDAGAAADSGASSSLQGFMLNQQLSAEEAAGVSAPTSISGYSDHALSQIVGRDGGIGVSQAALEDAFANPNAIEYAPSTYGPTFRFTGNNATVVVNPNGTVVTGWATGSGGIVK